MGSQLRTLNYFELGKYYFEELSSACYDFAFKVGILFLNLFIYLFVSFFFSFLFFSDVRMVL